MSDLKSDQRTKTHGGHGKAIHFHGEATGDRGEATGDRGEATNFRGEATNPPFSASF